MCKIWLGHTYFGTQMINRFNKLLEWMAALLQLGTFSNVKNLSIKMAHAS